MTATPPTVLIADDEPRQRLLARMSLESDGFQVVGEAVNGAQAVERYLELDPPPGPSVVLVDHRMPVLSGLDAAEQILARDPDQLVVLFSGQVDSEIEARARELGVAACVAKTRAAELPSILRSLLD